MLKNVDYQIAENGKGDKYFYKMTDPYLTGPKPEGKSLSNTQQSDANIIKHSSSEFNPSKPLIKNEPVVKPPDSDDEWRKRLRRKRRGLF